MSSGVETGHVGWGEILTRVHGPALALVSMGVWLHAADGLLVATMMPAILADIGGGRLVAWTVALYEVGSIVAGAASGLAAVRYGIRTPMVTAAALFALGCAISAAAPTMPIVLAGRLLQGFGGGGLVALSFVAVSILFPRRLTARVLAVVSTLWGMSAFLGPLVGGLFVEYATWRAGFWFFALQAIVLALWIGLGVKLPARDRRTKTASTVPGLRLLLLSAGVFLVALGGIEVTVVRTSLFCLAGLACLAGFLRLDARETENRLLPSAPFGLRTPQGTALTMILCFSMATVAALAYGPLLITRLHGTSALVAGYVIACASIAWTVVAVTVSGADERHDPKFIVAGMTLVTLGIVGFAYSVPNGPVWLTAVAAAMQGGGFGMAWTFVLRRITALAPRGETERISGALPTVQRLGVALGAAYVGIIANAAGFAEARDPGDLATTAAIIYLACLPLALAGLVAMVRFVRWDTGPQRAQRATDARA